jgi:8-hydroxy-5-deazaflavin:NADPH oxidoreductase
MTIAIIGTGGIGSAIARQLASGDETLRLSSAGIKSARTLAAEIGGAAVVAAGNRVLATKPPSATGIVAELTAGL